MGEMAKFGSAEAFSNVQAALNASMTSEDQLARTVEHEVEPQVHHWRKGIGEVLQWFGLGIDYGEIMGNAERAFDKEQELRRAMIAAGGEADSFLRHSQRLAAKALEQEELKLQRLVNQVMQRGDMDASQKAAAIRRLKDAAQEKRQLALEKAQLIMASQQGASLSLDSQMQLLHTLVDRAYALQRSVAEPPTAEELQGTRQETIKQMDQARESYERQRFAVGSLLQLSREHDTLRDATERAAAGSG